MRRKKKGPYKSGLEINIAKDLENNNVRFQYEGYTLPYKRRVNSGECDACGGGKVSQRKHYTPDFTLLDSNGRRTILVESKGRLTATDRGKMLAVKEAHPDLDIRFVFARNNKTNKNKEERYSDWATKHEFKFHIGNTIPREWFEGLQSSSSLQGDRVQGSLQKGRVKVRRRRHKQ